jgi:hypothetical protein
MTHPHTRVQLAIAGGGEGEELHECSRCGEFVPADRDAHECDVGGECGICGATYPPGSYLKHLDECTGP